MAPQQEGAAAGHVGRGLGHAEGVAEHGVPVPVAHVGGGDRVGTPDEVEQARGPLVDVVHGGAAGGPPGHGDGFGAVAALDVEQAGRDVVQGVVPAHPIPARIVRSLGPGAPQRIVQALLVVHQLRGGLALDADGPAVGVVVVGVEPGHPSVLYRGDGGAVRGAQHAIAADLLHVWMLRHLRKLPAEGGRTASPARARRHGFERHSSRFGLPAKPSPQPASRAAQPPATRPLKMDGPSMVPSRPAWPLMWPPAMPATSPAA